jgi:PIN domain nuclease of toxin-antitoxin system
VFAEALDISEKGKAEFDFARMYQFIRTEPEFEVIRFSPEILEEALRIKEVREIHDRIIVATARFYEAGIMTKDHIISESGEVEVL